MERHPRVGEVLEKLDSFTTHVAYVRWLGDQKGIEELAKTWDKPLADRRADLMDWGGAFQKFVARNIRILAYANNHYAGHRPATVKLFWDLFEKR